MCGIVGYIGKNKQASNILIEGLSKLEYRGYDSAGLSIINDNKITTIKTQGHVEELNKLICKSNQESNIGIAHTRWATHGKPSTQNAHPHNDNSNTISVVHNGIIENFNELKRFLKEQSYTFHSTTDTEVIPNLIHYYFSKNKQKNIDSFLKSINTACKDLIGSYALEIISPLFPNTIIITKKDSPIVIGKSKNEFFISSDITAYLSHTNQFYYLNDFEYALIQDDNITFFDTDLNQINKKSKKIDVSPDSIEKKGYEDFMLKEIFEQPTSIRNTISEYMPDNKNLDFKELNITKKYLQNINQIYIIACGTAMHAGLTGKNIFENLLQIPTQVEIASEFRYKNPIINEKTLCIFISQSGETADTIAALKLAKHKNSKTLAISNVKESTITREADYTIYTVAGPEIAVASTKAYTAQIIVLALLGIHFSNILEINKTMANSLMNSIHELPSKIETVLSDTNLIKKIATKYSSTDNIFFLGRNVDYNTATEASLKLKEISYIHSEAFYSGELKHGPIALIDNSSLIISIITVDELVKKSISNIQEVISRGAQTLIITDQTLDNDIFNNVVNVPKTNNFLTPILAIIPLQLFAYYIAKNKNLNVDKPRNLAKSVTVE